MQFWMVTLVGKNKDIVVYLCKSDVEKIRRMSYFTYICVRIFYAYLSLVE